MRSCTRCNQENLDNANFCHQCGTPLEASTEAGAPAAAGPDPAPAPDLSQAPDSSAVPDEKTIWRQFIGPNADHYLETFRKFSVDGQPKFALSWNWPAFLYISFLWFLYRKMYLHAFVYAVGPVVSTYLTGDASASIVWSIMAGATANYLYYWHCWEHIGEIKKSGHVTPDTLRESGGVQPYVIWVGVVLYILFFMTLIKMVQEGPPGLDGQPTKSDRPAAMTGI
ncbi:MAG: DUF2628 domain-containing protein [Nitrospira sp.]|nr:DUF2628 domain-containing protein [Nitrospira sp.]